MGGFWPDLLSDVNVKFNLMAIFVFRTQKLVGFSGWMGVLEYFISSAVLTNVDQLDSQSVAQQNTNGIIRLFAFIAGGGGGRGEQFSTPVGDHVHVSKAKTLISCG